MSRFSLLLALATAAACGLAPAHAAKVKVWHHAAAAHHEKACFQGAVVSNEGALRLARRLQPLADLDATHVWDVVEDKDGNLLVATGDEGKLYKVTPDGKVTVAFDCEDSQVLCLAQAPDGSVYAGTGPNGRLLRLTPDGKGQLLYQSAESYIWCLAVEPRGETVYAGTGPKGRIYQINSKGEAKLFYATKQEHILSLAVGPDSTLYAGTDKNGLVYRFDATGKGFVLFNAAQSEVRRLVAGPDGVYAGTSAPRRSGVGNRSVADRPPSSGISSVLTSNVKTATKMAASDSSPGNTGSASSAKEEEKKGAAAPTAPPPGQGENSVYRIAADGTAREIFREKAMVLSLLRQGGRFFVGTGTDGQLFEVDEKTKERSEIARLDHGEIHCLCRRRDGSIVLGTGDPGKLYVLQDQYTLEGTVTSEVLDAKLVSTWGSLHWKANTPPGTCVTVAVRSGNLAEPDETWSDWSSEQTDAEAATAAAPPARYLQYRVRLATDDPAVTPALRSLTLRYSTRNQAPEVTAVEVPDLDAANLDNPKKLKFKWTATDPNEDELTYGLYVRKDGWTNWVMLENNLEKREYEWDTTTAPAGIYQLKVVASDRKDNTAEDALTGERVSAAFPVAHVPPTVTVKIATIEGGRAVIEATARDPLVRLTAASFAVDGKAWVNVFPADGLFDRNTATFRFTTETLKPGTHVLVLRVRDAAGNIGSGDVVFMIPE